MFVTRTYAYAIPCVSLTLPRVSCFLQRAWKRPAALSQLVMRLISLALIAAALVVVAASDPREYVDGDAAFNEPELTDTPDLAEAPEPALTSNAEPRFRSNVNVEPGSLSSQMLPSIAFITVHVIYRLCIVLCLKISVYALQRACSPCRVTRHVTTPRLLSVSHVSAAAG